MDAFLAKHLQGVSRTYAILVPMLPDTLADAVGVAYLLMRIVDTLEDDPHLSAADRRGYFALLESALGGSEAAATSLAQPLGDTDDERALMRDAAQVISRVRALEPEYHTAVATCAQAMTAGVRHLIARSAERGLAYPAVRDMAELREYCYYVAGVVGEMLCTMMAHFLRWPELRRLRDQAVELGIGLQLVNILKDAGKDSAQGRRYLPLAEGDASAPAEVYTAVLQAARQSLQTGVDYVLALPASARELRSFCGLPIAWGALTLARAECAADAAKIGRADIRDSITRFGELVNDDQALRHWLSALLEAGAGGRVHCG
jgi:farnesyl-diphosphate farnesyltransferase